MISFGPKYAFLKLDKITFLQIKNNSIIKYPYHSEQKNYSRVKNKKSENIAFLLSLLVHFFQLKTFYLRGTKYRVIFR